MLKNRTAKLERGAHFCSSSLRSETKMAKIIHEKSKCIGCGSCVALCPEFFEMDEGGKAHLKDSKLNSKTEIEELEISKEGCEKEAVDVCPVKCIKIV